MTTKFYMYTNAIGPNKKVYMVPNIIGWDFENLKERFKNHLSKEGQDTVKLNLTTTLSEIHYDICCKDLFDFTEQLTRLYPVKVEANEILLDYLAKILTKNNIKYSQFISSHLDVTFHFFDETYKFVIYLNENNEFMVDHYINGSFEARYNGYVYDEEFRQPHTMTYYDDKDHLFTVDQIVKVMKITKEIESKVIGLKHDLPF